MLTVEKVLVVAKPIIKSSANDACPICKIDIMSSCINCESHMKNTKCPIEMGCCGHVFHSHCITKWLDIRSICPLDNKHWEKAKEV
jgi:RING-box protein 1